VITDIVMPVMGGRDLVENLAPLLKRRRVLFVTGFEAGKSSETTLQPGFGFLRKPFNFKQLADKVRELLAVPF
jgi:FixJ family two-component response regulator